ncbi:MAG TPA: hypothetical protein VF765_06810 [Polyangiaceae bacterium]
MIGWIGTWARPADRPSQVALGFAVALLAIALVPGGPRWFASVLDFASLAELSRRRRFLTVSAFAAAFLSLGYIAFYLRGGPRDLLAPAYWLQGRALSHGDLSWTAPEPSASFRARHLLFAPPDHVAGVLPPGYPLLLAAGFLVGAPMLVGPLLAAGLVVATWFLAREIALASGETADRAESIARVAVGLSVVSAALRVHTADALPHGAAAVAVALALACAFHARRVEEPRLYALAGLAVGATAAIHPASAVPAGAVVAAIAAGDRDRGRAASWGIAAALPGILLLLLANRAATGHALASPLTAYFGSVEPRPPLRIGEALLTTVRRLRVHLLDVDNLEPLALLALVPLLRPTRSSAVVLAALVVAGQIVVAAPFDASTVGPGTGARLLVSAIPIEHALAAIALAQLFPKRLASAAVATMALALAGFAVHASHDHARLAASDRGHPHYEPDVVREAGVEYGLLYFEDDAGFELAYDPSVQASHGLLAVRMRGDDHDRLLWDALGHPPIHRYTLPPATLPTASASPSVSVPPPKDLVPPASSASVVSWTPPGEGTDIWHFEAEADWPAAAQSGGRVEVEEGVAPCASDGKVLTLTPTTPQATATLALPVPRGSTAPDKRTWMVVPRIIDRGGGGSAKLSLYANLDDKPLAEWTWESTAKSPQCLDLDAKPVDLGGPITRAWLVLSASRGIVSLDKTTLRAH